MRSFGGSPTDWNCEIVLLRPASSVAILTTSPPGPEIAVYLSCAVCCAATIWERTAWIESVRLCDCWTSACLADRSDGGFETSDQAFQNLASWELIPFSPGSWSDSSALSSESARACQSLRFVFCARYCESRKESRMRRKPWTSTPVPRCAPVCTWLPWTWIGRAGEAASVASWRE